MRVDQLYLTTWSMLAESIDDDTSNQPMLYLVDRSRYDRLLQIFCQNLQPSISCLLGDSLAVSALLEDIHLVATKSPDIHWKAVAIEFGAYVLSSLPKSSGAYTIPASLHFAIVAACYAACDANTAAIKDNHSIVRAGFRAIRLLIDTDCLIEYHPQLKGSLLKALHSDNSQTCREAATCFRSLFAKLRREDDELIFAVINAIQQTISVSKSNIVGVGNALDWLEILLADNALISPIKGTAIIRLDLSVILELNNRILINRLVRILNLVGINYNNNDGGILIGPLLSLPPDQRWPDLVLAKKFPEFAVHFLTESRLADCINQIVEVGKLGLAWRLLDCYCATFSNRNPLLPTGNGRQFTATVVEPLLELTLKGNIAELIQRYNFAPIVNCLIYYVRERLVSPALPLQIACAALESNGPHAMVVDIALELLLICLKRSHGGERESFPPGWLGKILSGCLQRARDFCDMESLFRLAIQALYLGRPALFDHEANDLIQFVEKCLSATAAEDAMETSVGDLSTAACMQCLLSGAAVANDQQTTSVPNDWLQALFRIIREACLRTLGRPVLDDGDDEMIDQQIIALELLTKLSANTDDADIDKLICTAAVKLIDRLGGASRLCTRLPCVTINRLVSSVSGGMRMENDMGFYRELKQRLNELKYFLQHRTEQQKSAEMATDQSEWSSLLGLNNSGHRRLAIDDDLECEENHLHLDCF